MSPQVRQETSAIGARISQLRKERGITQVELAEFLGVSQPVVSLYERGAVALRGDQIAALSRLLNVSADELLGLSAGRGARAAAPRDTRLAKRIRELELLPRRDKDALLRTIDAFLSARAPTSSS